MSLPPRNFSLDLPSDKIFVALIEFAEVYQKWLEKTTESLIYTSRFFLNSKVLKISSQNEIVKKRNKVRFLTQIKNP